MHNPAVTKYGMQVISGGQTGVDLAALRIAQCLGLRTGGLAPKGWKTSAGSRPQLKTTFRLEEGVGGYSDRTRRNVERAQATLIIANDLESSGTKLTIACAAASDRPVHTIKLPDPGQQGIELALVEGAVDFIEAQAKLVGNGPFILNVAGNSSRTKQGIFIPAFFVLAEIFVRLARRIDVVEAEHIEHFKHRLLSDGQMINALNDNYEYYSEIDPRGLKGMIV